MTSPELENLARIGKLKPEPPSAAEIAALMRSGHARLVDARNESLSVESRFDLAYNAAHAIALAALRRLGFRSDNRYIVFQALPHTAGIDTVNWRVLAKAHGERNMLEYEGGGMIDQRLLDHLLAAAGLVEAKVTSLIVGDATQHRWATLRGKWYRRAFAGAAQPSICRPSVLTRRALQRRAVSLGKRRARRTAPAPSSRKPVDLVQSA